MSDLTRARLRRIVRCAAALCSAQNKDNLFASIVMGIQQTKNKFIAGAHSSALFCPCLLGYLFSSAFAFVSLAWLADPRLSL
jgi:hypothetical protein